MKDDDRIPRAGLRDRARKRVTRKYRFFVHALVFVTVNLGLFIKHGLTGSPWPGPALWGWGLGLGVHGLLVFLGQPGEGLRERMLRQEIERMRRDE